MASGGASGGLDNGALWALFRSCATTHMATIWDLMGLAVVAILPSVFLGKSLFAFFLFLFFIMIFHSIFIVILDFEGLGVGGRKSDEAFCQRGHTTMSIFGFWFLGQPEFRRIGCGGYHIPHGWDNWTWGVQGEKKHPILENLQGSMAAASLRGAFYLCSVLGGVTHITR